ncbi:MAG: sulfatase-like hydrolase/transferase, partial [Verrucomicrobiales bacterium]|nr:sulfatase-like hydrolase/transferase [Verrucomicrobiales bacterium]
MRIATLSLFILFQGILLPLRSDQPNVLIIVADDFGWGDLSSNGNRQVETPNLDGLAGSGLRFEK